MKNTKLSLKVLQAFVVFVLITAMALTVSACQNKKEVSSRPEGSKVTFTLTVTDIGGKETDFNIETAELTVGAALTAEGLIEEKDGLVSSVNGITADYEKDGCYWAFYVDGKYALKGVNETEIESGRSYAFKVEKA